MGHRALFLVPLPFFVLCSGSILGTWFQYRSCSWFRYRSHSWFLAHYNFFLGAGTALGSCFWHRSWYLVPVPFLFLVPVPISFWYHSWFLVSVLFFVLVLFLVLGSSTTVVPIHTNLTYLILSPHIIKYYSS